MSSPAPLPDLSRDEFHEALHTDIQKPIKSYRIVSSGKPRRPHRIPTGAHRLEWATALVDLPARHVKVEVYLNFKQSGLTTADHAKLVRLACEGIERYWSKPIQVAGRSFSVRVSASHRPARSIPVTLSIENGTDYARSMNPATLGVDARFIYNAGTMAASADDDFRLVSAHEFGHSVLMHAGGIPLSWGHKGSTNPVLQAPKSSAPGYPATGPIDLMKYFDPDKRPELFSRRMRDTVAVQADIKRLIWGAEISWTK